MATHATPAAQYLFGRLIIAGLVLMLATTSQAATFHVSPDGNDRADGDEDAPFATISRGVKKLKPGDTLILHSGTYRESVKLPEDGKASAPITIKAAEKANVIIAGDDPVDKWQERSAGRWQARCKGPVTQVFCNGLMMTEASWPNTPPNPLKRAWADADEGTKAGLIVDDDLADIDATGSQIHILPGRKWVSWTRPVERHDRDANALEVKTNWPQKTAYKVQEGTQYYLFGSRALLDAPGEWWFDAENDMLHVILPKDVSLPNADITVKRRTLAIDLQGKKHIHIKGIRVRAATISLADATHCLVENCHIRYASHLTEARSWTPANDTGLIVSGKHNVVRKCSVVYSAGNGISLLGERNLVENCVVRYTDYIATDHACVWAEGRHNKVRRCTLSHTGRSVFIHRKMKAGVIEYNDMHHAGMLTTDLGITYCFQSDGEGTVIAHNWTHDNVSKHVGVGIYIDNGSSNFLIHHNVSWNNPDSGIRLNTPSKNNRLYNNTVINNGNSLSYWGPNNLDDQPGCELVNNVLTDKVNTGEGMDMHHNYTGDTSVLRDPQLRNFQPKEGSQLINAGIELPGITDGYKGDAPDIGAYEFGATPWSAGHDWGEPPVF